MFLITFLLQLFSLLNFCMQDFIDIFRLLLATGNMYGLGQVNLSFTIVDVLD